MTAASTAKATKFRIRRVIEITIRMAGMMECPYCKAISRP